MLSTKNPLGSLPMSPPDSHGESSTSSIQSEEAIKLLIQGSSDQKVEIGCAFVTDYVESYISDSTVKNLELPTENDTVRIAWRKLKGDETFHTTCNIIPSNDIPDLDVIFGTGYTADHNKTGSNPRLSKHDVDMLEQEFQREKKPNISLRRELAARIGVDITRVNNWYQNRRAKARHEMNAAKAEQEMKTTKSMYPAGERAIAIRNIVFKTLKDHASGMLLIDMEYSVVWDIPLFLTQKYPGESLGSVFVLIGSSKEVQGIRVKNYIMMMWPQSGLKVLEAIDGLVNSHIDGPHYDRSHQVAVQHINADMVRMTQHLQKGANPDVEEHQYPSTDMYQTKALFRISGDVEEHIQIVTTIAWLISAVRYNPNETTHLSHVLVERTRLSLESTTRLHIELGNLQAIDSDSGCWHKLFEYSVIASGFPVSPRKEGMGLELTYDDMLALARSHVLSIYDSGVVAEGLSSLLIPMKRLKVDDAVQWHLEERSPPSSTDIEEVLKRREFDSRLKDMELAEVRTQRVFLGWVETSQIILGTEDARFREVQTSGLPELPQTRRFWNFGGGLTGGSHGASATLNVSSVPKIINSRMARSDRKHLLGILQDAVADPIIVYDEAVKIAWNVPKSSLILFIIHIFIVTRKLHSSSKIPFTSRGLDGGLRSKETIIASLNHQLYWIEDPTEKCSLRSITERICNDMLAVCSLLNGAHRDDQFGKLFSRISGKNKLLGVDLLDLVLQPELIAVREKVVEQKWVSLTKKQPMVLFCKDLGQVIKSTQDDGLCQKWSCIPSGSDYMVATSHILVRLLKQNDPKGMRLGEGVIWSPSNPLIQRHKGSSTCCHIQNLSTSTKPTGVSSLADVLQNIPGSAFVFGSEPSSCSLELPEQLQRNDKSKHAADLPENIVLSTTTEISPISYRQHEHQVLEYRCS